MRGLGKKITAAAILILAVMIAAGCGKSLEKQIEEQLQLGQKYLSEMNYEEAVVAFQKVIELDPKNLDGYQNLGDVYEILAGIAGGDAEEDQYYDLAMDAFEKMAELDASNAYACERLQVIYKRFGNLDKLRHLLEYYQGDQSGEMKQLLNDLTICLDLIEEISGLCTAGNIEQVFDIMSTEDYEKLQDFIDEMKYPAFIMEGNTGLGIYNVETRDYGNSMIYYGDFRNGLREGTGYWIGYMDGNNYQAHGEWRNDVPEGQQVVREWNGGLSETVSIRQISGQVDQGLWNGDVLWEFERNGGTLESFPVGFTNGNWIVLRISEDGSSIVSDTGGAEGSSTMSATNPDELEGIEGFLS